jgi:flagellar biosynthetic protein FliQ
MPSVGSDSIAVNHAISLAEQGLIASLEVLIPVLAVTLLVGFIVGIFQATTQIQEQTLSFAPKLLVLAFILLLAGPLFLHILTNFAVDTLGTFWRYVP